MPPKFGLLTNPTEDVLKEIRAAKELGMDYVEIGIEPPRCLPEQLLKKRKDILSLLKRYRMFAVGHTAWWYNLGSQHSNIRKAWVEEGKRTIRMSKELGIRLLNFHLEAQGMSLRQPRFLKRIISNFIESMRELVEYGKGFGVKVMFENGAGSPEFSRIETIDHILKEVPGLGFHMDIGHIFIAEGQKGTERAIRKFSRRLVHVHIHDNYGTADDHLPLGVAVMDYESIVRALKMTGYRKGITFEVFARDRDYLKLSMEKVKKAWRNRSG